MSFLSKYWFWLIVVSASVMLLERLFPWRKQQKFARAQLGQDVFFLGFNGYIFGILFGGYLNKAHGGMERAIAGVSGVTFSSLKLFSGRPLWVQVIIVFLAADFIEWLVHNALHRMGFLWKIHRVHHSIKEMDWIGNFRFNWFELVVYKTVKYLPLAMLGIRWDAILIASVTTLAIGHLNHSNMNISWGPLRYLLNSPRMHIWHHEKDLRGKAGVNFGIALSLWDWIFGTAYMPTDARLPREIGYGNEDKVPTSLGWRMLWPFYERR